MKYVWFKFFFGGKRARKEESKTSSKYSLRHSNSEILKGKKKYELWYLEYYYIYQNISFILIF